MNQKFIFIILFLVFLFFSPLNSQAIIDYPLIVEFQIAGEKSSDDFIKIYNPTNSDIFLSNYKGSYLRLVKRTKTSTKDYSIKSWSQNPEAKIPAKGFYLWANKDFTKLANADTSTSQTISANNGIALRLGPENTGEIIDAVGWGGFNNLFFEENPFPENPGPNQKLERKEDQGIYQDTNNNSQDFYLNPPPENISKETKTPLAQTPKLSENSSLKTELKTTLPAKAEASVEQIFPSGIVINEILPSPEGPDEKEEWIEVFNENNFEVDISGWKLEDKAGQTTIYVFPENKKIPPKDFLVLFRPKTKITLNNDGDSLNLIQPNGNITDKINYEKAPLGKSYNRTSSGWAWSAILTPGKINIIPEKTKLTENGSPLAQPEEVEPPTAENFFEQETASIGEKMEGPANFASVLLIAFIVAIFSAVIILILKKKLSA